MQAWSNCGRKGEHTLQRMPWSCGIKMFGVRLSSQVRAHPGRENLVLKGNSEPRHEMLSFSFTLFWVLWVVPRTLVCPPPPPPKSTGRVMPHLKESYAPSFHCSLQVRSMFEIQVSVKGKSFSLLKLFIHFMRVILWAVKSVLNFRSVIGSDI